jgi:hypothetical protein
VGLMRWCSPTHGRRRSAQRVVRSGCSRLDQDRHNRRGVRGDCANATARQTWHSRTRSTRMATGSYGPTRRWSTGCARCAAPAKASAMWSLRLAETEPSGRSRIVENLRVRVPPIRREPRQPDFGDQSKATQRVLDVHICRQYEAAGRTEAPLWLSVSAKVRPSRRSSGRSWSSFTTTGSAPLGRFASSRDELLAGTLQLSLNRISEELLLR